MNDETEMKELDVIAQKILDCVDDCIFLNESTNQKFFSENEIFYEDGIITVILRRITEETCDMSLTFISSNLQLNEQYLIPIGDKGMYHALSYIKRFLLNLLKRGGNYER